MKQFNIAQFGLLAGAGIGLLMVIFSGANFRNINKEVVAQSSQTETIHQPTVTPSLPIPKKAEDVGTSVVIKSPKRTAKEGDNNALSTSYPIYPPAQPKDDSPFYVVSKSKIYYPPKSSPGDFFSRDNDNQQDEEFSQLPKRLSPHVRLKSPLRYSGEPTEAEQKLDAIGNQLNNLAKRSELEHQRGIRKSEQQVRHLQREMRISKLNNHLQQLKWSRTARQTGERRLSKIYQGQRYIFISKNDNSEKTDSPLTPFMAPIQVEPEVSSPQQPRIAKEWSPTKSTEKR